MSFNRLAILSLAFSASLTAAASATTLFSDNFQGDLSQWNAGSGGQIVANPLADGGKALDFTRTIGGGDLFAAAGITSSTGLFNLTIDYLGTCPARQGCGGFVGFNNPGETWFIGSDGYSPVHPITETGAWQTISFDFTSATPIVLKLEDFNGSSDGGVPGNAFFRNLVVTDGAAPIPEPTSMALLGAALAALGLRRRQSV